MMFAVVNLVIVFDQFDCVMCLNNTFERLYILCIFFVDDVMQFIFCCISSCSLTPHTPNSVNYNCFDFGCGFYVYICIDRDRIGAAVPIAALTIVVIIVEKK